MGWDGWLTGSRDKATVNNGQPTALVRKQRSGR